MSVQGLSNARKAPGWFGTLTWISAFFTCNTSQVKQLCKAQELRLNMHVRLKKMARSIERANNVSR